MKKEMVTGGWDLQEREAYKLLCKIRNLSSASGVQKFASIGQLCSGNIKIDVDPEENAQYNIVRRCGNCGKESNQDIGAQTLEINQADIWFRVGYVKSVADIENASTLTSRKFHIYPNQKDIAKVHLRPSNQTWNFDKKVPKS